MGTNRSKFRILVMFKKARCAVCSESGDAVVEATILFPVMTMIFAALVLIAMYLPAQAALQNAAQYAASTIATVISDTWLFFDEDSMLYYTETDRKKLGFVYAGLFKLPDAGSMGERIVENIEGRSIRPGRREMSVTCFINNKAVYKEVIAQASCSYPLPVNLSFIGFPKTFTVTSGAVAVVQNGDEFVRSIDLAYGFAAYAAEKFNLSDIGQAIKNFGDEIMPMLSR